MQVILLEKIRNLGDLGDTVSVKPGYGRNFLIPQNKAIFATTHNIAQFELKRAELEKKAQKQLEEAQKRADELSKVTLVVQAQASDEGKLYGSVGVNEIQEAFEAQSMDVSKREIMLPDGPFYSVGQYVVNIQVHSDVVAAVTLDIVVA